MWDIYISYASKDKEEIVRPLAEALTTAGLQVWYNEFILKPGDSISHSIEEGINKSRYALIILSPNYYRSKWAEQELKGFLNRAIKSRQTVIIPIWHNVTYDDVHRLFPQIADIVPISTEKGLDVVVREILRAIQSGDKEIEKELERYNDLLKREPGNTEYLQQKATILRRLDRESEYLDAIQRLEEIQEQQKFEENLSKQITIQRLELEDLDFFGTFTWRLSPHINILLGKNGYGKSHLLSLLVTLLQRHKERSTDFIHEDSQPEASAKIHINSDDAAQTIHFTKLGFEKKKNVGKIPVLAISELRFIDKSQRTVRKEDEADTYNLKEHGAYHFLKRRSLGPLIQNFLMGLCITYTDKKTFDLGIFKLFSRVLGILTAHQFQFDDIKRVGDTGYEISVLTEGNDRPLPLQQASQGTLSIMAIIILIYNYLQSVFPDTPEEELAQKPAIVFIDELDAHMHPSWQQKIVGILRSSFPRVQFIIAAHSPLLVAGCKEGEVAVLRKRDEKGFTLQQIEHHLMGVTTNDLYQIIFEVEEKDETFLRYAAMYPFRERIKKEIEQLEQKKGDPGRLNELYERLYYINEYEHVQQEREKQANSEKEKRALEWEVKKLKRELEELKDRENRKS